MDMNSPIDLNSADSSFVSSLPLSMLRFIELKALERRYASLVRTLPEQDRWFVSSEKGAFGPMRFSEALRRLVNGAAPLAILHEDEAAQEPEPWQTIEYRPCALDRTTEVAWIAGFWMVAIFLGWIAVMTLAPGSLESLVQWAYFAGVAGAIVWLSLPQSIRSKIRAKSARNASDQK